MIEIKTNQKLEVHNVLSFRGKMRQSELENVVRDMETKLTGVNAKKVGSPITATFGIEGDYLDVEVIQPIDKHVGNISDYQFKEKIEIVNAVVVAYKGNPAGLQEACNKLNQYIIDNKLQPITVGYNVTKHIDPVNMEDAEIDVYVGISPNTL